MDKLGSTLGYIAAVILPAIVLVYYIHTVAEAKEEAMALAQAREPEPEILKDAAGRTLDPATNMIISDGYPTVKKQCARCHPTTLIITYRADRAGWLETIRWMQTEKGLPEFTPATEATILNYLTEAQ